MNEKRRLEEAREGKIAKFKSRGNTGHDSSSEYMMKNGKVIQEGDFPKPENALHRKYEQRNKKKTNDYRRKRSALDGQVVFDKSTKEVDIDERVAMRGPKKSGHQPKTIEHAADKHKDSLVKLDRAITDRRQTASSISNKNEDGRHAVKTFTKEEIEQMSTHNKKRLPIYMATSRYSSGSPKKTTEVEVSHRKSRTMQRNAMNRSETMKRDSANDNQKQGSDTSTETNHNSRTCGPKEHTATAANLVRISNVLSPSLLKLQETNIARPTKVKEYKRRSYKGPESKNAQIQQLQIAARSKSCEKEEFPKQKMKSVSSKSKVEKMKQTNQPDLLKQNVVFTLDMDDVSKKERNNYSFFRRKIFRKKSAKPTTIATQTDIEVQTKLIQSNPWTIPGLFKSQFTQTSFATNSSATQTVEPTTENAEVQCVLLKQDSYPQTLPKPKLSKDCNSTVSLDDLVQHRMQRRAKSVINRKTQEEISEPLKRSETVHGRNREATEKLEGKRTSKPIKAFNWSQTEKFVKVIISHNGIHLIPVNQIKVKSNGFNLKLQIEDTGDNHQNSNKNNNNSSVTLHELNVDRLYHPVIHLSYTIQPDMVTILLRKKVEKTWKELEKSTPEKLIITAAQVYL